jgi:lipopolysaccharide transport system ATP-binding protein
MTDEIAISVNGLGKLYNLGETVDLARNFRETLMGLPRLLGRAAGGRSAKKRGNEMLWALRDLNFEIKRGEAVGIIGRNGAGKSTLLKVLSRITWPTTGQVTVRGRVGSLLEVGTGFHAELTGRENIFLNGAILGMRKSEIDRKFDEIVEFSGVEKFLETPVKRYSTGMRVRLAFAVAAHLDPEILIIDEVLAVGDQQFQKKCLGKMEEVTQSERTVLFVSHNMAAVQNLCPRGILLEQGRMVVYDSVGKVVAEYIRSLGESSGNPTEAIATDKTTGVVLRSYRVLNDGGETVAAMQCGSPGEIVLELETPAPLKHLMAVVAIDDFETGRICVLHSKISGHALSIEAPGGSLVCRIDRCQLAPGNYGLTVKITEGSDVLFWLPSVLELTVEGGDFYGSGQLPAEWGGKILVEHSWRTVAAAGN